MTLAPPRLFALTALLALAAVAAALVGDRVGADARGRAARDGGALTVMVMSPPETIARATAALRATPGVIEAAPIDAARAARLLDPQGGVLAADLPPLRLIEVRRTPDATDAALRTALRDAGVRAEIRGADVAPALRTARIASGAGLAGALALLLAIALAHATRRTDAAALAADLGAPRAATLAAHGRAAAPEGFAAGALAASAVASVATGVHFVAAEPVSFGAMLARVSAPELALLLLAPLASAAAATLGARMGAAHAYDRAERLA